MTIMTVIRYVKTETHHLGYYYLPEAAFCTNLATNLYIYYCQPLYICTILGPVLHGKKQSNEGIVGMQCVLPKILQYCYCC